MKMFRFSYVLRFRMKMKLSELGDMKEEYSRLDKEMKDLTSERTKLHSSVRWTSHSGLTCRHNQRLHEHFELLRRLKHSTCDTLFDITVSVMLPLCDTLFGNVTYDNFVPLLTS